MNLKEEKKKFKKEIIQALPYILSKAVLLYPSLYESKVDFIFEGSINQIPCTISYTHEILSGYGG